MTDDDDSAYTNQQRFSRLRWFTICLRDWWSDHKPGHTRRELDELWNELDKARCTIRELTERVQAENRVAAIIAFAREANPSLPHVPLPKSPRDRHLRPVP